MKKHERRTMKGVLIATLSLLAIPQLSLADLAELVGKLNLSTYPRVTRAPDFSAQTTDGRTVSLASRHGKVVLLNFWATWCQECRPEMSMFEQLHREFAAQGLSVIGINAREGAAAIRAYASELNLTFPLVVDPKGEINASYGVVGVPATFLIGRDGRALARAVGAREWNSAPSRKLIQELLADSAR